MQTTLQRFYLQSLLGMGGAMKSAYEALVGALSIAAAVVILFNEQIANKIGAFPTVSRWWALAVVLAWAFHLWNKSQYAMYVRVENERDAALKQIADQQATIESSTMLLDRIGTASSDLEIHALIDMAGSLILKCREVKAFGFAPELEIRIDNADRRGESHISPPENAGIPDRGVPYPHWFRTTTRGKIFLVAADWARRRYEAPAFDWKFTRDVVIADCQRIVRLIREQGASG